MRATKCDACGGLVENGYAVSLEAHLPYTNDSEGTAKGWPEVEICFHCWRRPFAEVMEAACDGMKLRDRMGEAPDA